MIATLPPPPPAIVWHQIAETALQNNNLTADIRVSDSSITVVQSNKKHQSYVSQEETLANLKKSFTAYFSTSVAELEEEIKVQGGDAAKLNDFKNESEILLNAINENIENDFNVLKVKTSQSIQEAEEGGVRALFFLRKYFLNSEITPQCMQDATGQWSVTRLAPLPKTLVLSGGGIRGVGYVGAFNVMEATNFLNDVELIAGSSAGAMSAVLIASGCSAMRFQAINDQTNYLKMLTGASNNSLINQSVSLDQSGLFDGTAAMKKINEGIENSITAFFLELPNGLLEQKINNLKANGFLTEAEAQIIFNIKNARVVNNKTNSDANSFVAGNLVPKALITFQDLALLRKLDPLTFKDVIVTGFNKTKKREEYFGIETTPLMSLVEAVRISMSVPCLYQPLKNDQGDLLEDGGIGSNTPSEVSSDPSTTVVCAFDDNGTFAKIMNTTSFTHKFSVTGVAKNYFESWLSGSKNYQQAVDRDNQKIHNAGFNALDIYHGTLSAESFTASSQEINAAELQAEVRMWEQLELRQRRGIPHQFDTLEHAMNAISDEELEKLATYYAPHYQVDNTNSEEDQENRAVVFQAAQDEIVRRSAGVEKNGEVKSEG